MSLFQILSIVVVLAAIFSYLNYRYIKLPTTIGVMLVALAASVLLQFVGRFYPSLPRAGQTLLNSIQFQDTVLHGVLAFLLFAGALKVDLGSLNQQKWVVLVLSTVGVVVSTAIVGELAYLLLNRLIPGGVSASFCFLFGALISPTDPVAVLAIVRKAGAPTSLETKITAESLFNDGIGVVVFLSILQFTQSESHMSAGSVLTLLAVEAVGGLALGAVLGAFGYWMLKRVDDYHVEILITLALAMGGYVLAEALHTSAPLATVVSGLLIGNHGRMMAMSEKTRQHLDLFWELIDEILNVVLFALVGLQMLVTSYNWRFLLAGLAAIVIVLMGRWLSVAGSVAAMRTFHRFGRGAIVILTWAGLRGALSIAMALSLPAARDRDVILAITYAVVVFSIVVQGLTIGKLVRVYTAK